MAEYVGKREIKIYNVIRDGKGDTIELVTSYDNNNNERKYAKLTLMGDSRIFVSSEDYELYKKPIENTLQTDAARLISDFFNNRIAVT